MNFEIHIFKDNIDSDISNANEYVDRLHDSKMDALVSQLEEPELTLHEEEEKHNETQLEYYLQSIELKLTFAFDYLKLEKLYQNFQVDLKKSDNSDIISYYPYIGVIYSPKLTILRQYLNAITSVISQPVNEKNDVEIRLLERVLKGTPKIIHDNKLNPENENDIQKAVYNQLIHIFPDTVREFTLPNIAKNYKPDLGIRSLKIAIEYKFVDSELEAKKFSGEIFEDVHAYDGFEDWNVFYAVIYMTEAFMTQDQLEMEFKISKVPKNWKPIIVYGKGGRKNKKQ
ncbi:MAG: hypothetical protein V4580_07915 [Bacteroidota bacterium]